MYPALALLAIGSHLMAGDTAELPDPPEFSQGRETNWSHPASPQWLGHSNQPVC